MNHRVVHCILPVMDDKKYNIVPTNEDHDGYGSLKQADPDDPARSRSRSVPLLLGVLTSAYLANVEGFIHDLRERYSHLNVQFFELPYNRVEDYTFADKDFDIILLCHSINNRRFSITDVLDSLYDEFLVKAENTLGKTRVGVVVHDFPKEELATDEKYEAVMEAFQARQPTTFKHANLAMMTRKLDKSPVQLSESRWEEIRRFLEEAEKAVPKKKLHTPQNGDVGGESGGLRKYCLVVSVLMVVLAIILLILLVILL